ncbi:MAG: Trigger factor [Candidatus Dichloromethanomonas elyunquensis]|nr:MAG: Trigger factor [Candidatus Dichloromethanomonas elyunquensis]
MSVKVEQIEKNKVGLEILVPAKEFSLAIDRTAKKIAGEIIIPGFRKGKAPRHIIERYVGKEYLQKEAVDPVLGPAYAQALDESGIWPVSRPEVELIQVEEGKDLIFKAVVEVKPEVELGQYMGLGVEKKSPQVMEQQVDDELKRRQDLHAKLIQIDEGEIIDNDIAVIDFEGFIDGVPFAGGKGENHELTIGSNTFIPGFEEQLIGAHKDQAVDVNVRFPDEYHSKDLAGKEALFKVQINSIKRKELVPLDDEFAKDISEFETLSELREDVKQKMITAAGMRLNNEYRAEIVKKAVDNASVEIPEGMIRSKIDSMIADLQNNLSYQGVSLEQYYSYINSNEGQLRENYRAQAVERTKTELVLDAIAQKEGIAVSDEDVEKEMVKLSEQYGRKAEELKQILAAQGELEWFKIGIVSDRTIDLLVENNDVKKEEPEEETENTDAGKKE